MRDSDRLQHILENARFATNVLADGDPISNATDRLALERALYIIGEAARSLSDTTRDAIDQPWSRIIGLRVVLAHQYEVVEPTILARIARDNIPSLIDAIRAHLDEGLD